MAKEYITLKEAAKLSGYSSDYIGQLIRAGKIPGRQIYSNVAWITTKEDVLAYKNKQSDTDKTPANITARIGNSLSELKNRFLLEFKFTHILRWTFYAAIILAVMSLVVLFYAFSVSVDKKLERDALQQATSTSAVQQPQGDVIGGVPSL